MSVVITWLAFMTTGFALQLWLLVDVRRDLHALDVAKVKNGRRHLVESDIRSAWTMVGTFGFFAVTGLVALLRELNTFAPHSSLTRILLLAGAGLLVWNAVESRQVRRRLMSRNEKPT